MTATVSFLKEHEGTAHLCAAVSTTEYGREPDAYQCVDFSNPIILSAAREGIFALRVWLVDSRNGDQLSHIATTTFTVRKPRVTPDEHRFLLNVTSEAFTFVQRLEGWGDTTKHPVAATMTVWPAVLAQSQVGPLVIMHRSVNSPNLQSHCPRA